MAEKSAPITRNGIASMKIDTAMAENTLNVSNASILFSFVFDSGCWLLDSRYWVLVSGYWLLVSGYWLLVTGY